MTIHQLKRRATKLALTEPIVPREAELTLRREQRKRLIVYFITCVAPELQEIVFDHLVPHLYPLMRSCEPLPAEAHILARWIESLDVPGGTLPKPIPNELVQLFLGHPQAELLGWDCECCGVVVPSSQNQPLVEQCLCCGGPVGFQAYQLRHGNRFPSLAESLPDVGVILEQA